MRIRVGVIGFGVMGRNHYRALKAMDHVDVVGIAENTKSTFSEKISESVFPDASALLELGLDACIVATPTGTHADIAKMLGAAGVPTLIEKPISDTIDNAKEIIEAFRATNTLGAVGHIERFNPAMVQLKNHLDSGSIGELLQVATSRQSPFPSRVSDVGVITDLASHDIHSLLWISQSEYETQNAVLTDTNGDGREDLFFGSGKLANGVAYNHIVNWISPFKERKFVVTGTRGTLVADTLTGDLSLFENGTQENEWDSVANVRGMSEGNLIRFAYAKREPLVSELMGFLSEVRNQGEGEFVSLLDGLRVLEAAKVFSDFGSGT